MNPYYINEFLFYPRFSTLNEQPPTLYAIMNSIVNFGKEDKTKIKNLALESRTTIFDFDYPLSDKINKSDFECMILNHFMMRRIGFETFTPFQIQLNVKLNEIMPIYNKMFDVLENWNIFEDGETYIRSTVDFGTSESNNSVESNSTTNTINKSDRRHSDTPQNQLENIKDGSYVSDYDYDVDENSGNDNSNSKGNVKTTDNRNFEEISKRSPQDKINIYKNFIENRNNIYSMIFKDLECLFYQLV